MVSAQHTSQARPEHRGGERPVEQAGDQCRRQVFPGETAPTVPGVEVLKQSIWECQEQLCSAGHAWIEVGRRWQRADAGKAHELGCRQESGNETTEAARQNVEGPAGELVTQPSGGHRGGARRQVEQDDWPPERRSGKRLEDSGISPDSR